MPVRVLAVRPRPRPARRPGVVPVPSSSGSPSRWSSASSRPSAVPSSPSPVVPPVRVGWDELRGLDVAVCSACAESFASSCVAEVDEWAEVHRCDAELAALLALACNRRAA